MNRMLLVLGAVALLALGSATTYFVMKRASQPSDSMAGVPLKDVSRPAAALADIGITFSKEAVTRAGIVVGRASASAGPARLRIPAVVAPNAYRSVVVTPIVPGRVTSVSAELGQAVRRGQTLAQIYSPELSEAQNRYLTSRAALDAHERELRRTEKLTEIGSASRQELERLHAEHTAATSMVESLRSRLMLLGMTDGQIANLSTPSTMTAAVSIGSPIDGVVTARTANVGLNVDSSTQLFTVVDLSNVWLVGDLYERDFARVRIGTIAVVTTRAYPELMLEGKVSYIDPEINPQTRTARVRAEVPNRSGQLKIGMYAEMDVVDSRKSQVVMVPRDAVQIVGDRSVVYIADAKEPGRFVEREVQVGPATGADIEVLSGLQVGDSIVTKGSFALRAERERLGLRSVPSTQPAPDAAHEVRITVSEKGFEPPRVAAPAGTRLRLIFVRTSDATCATEVTIPTLKITRALPLNQPVDIELMPQKSGDIEFACGMEMFKGTIVVR